MLKKLKLEEKRGQNSFWKATSYSRWFVHLATGENITDHQSLSKPIQIFISTCIVSLLAIPSAPYLFRINPQRALPLNVSMGFHNSCMQKNCLLTSDWWLFQPRLSFWGTRSQCRELRREFCSGSSRGFSSGCTSHPPPSCHNTIANQKKFDQFYTYEFENCTLQWYFC